MFIFVMRHGEAVHTFNVDEHRPLTSRGDGQSQKAARWLKRYQTSQNMTISHALVSPFLRAQQTYQHIDHLLDIKFNQTAEDIVPSGDIHIAHDFVDAYCQSSSPVSGLLLVSHMPFVSYFIDELCQSQMSRIFTTASIVCIDYDLSTSKGQLVAEFSP
ncbi:phosphohistidine phosphatase SixA [Aliiglaciecola sp.]|nr:phosphohistidine phosphatase SixA [Aliiglaciecola sp.]